MKPMNKTGHIMDTPYFIGMIFALVIVLVVVGSVITGWFNSVEDDPFYNNTVVEHISSGSDTALNIFDKVIAFFVVAFTITTVMLAFHMRAYPIWFGASLLVLIISVGISATFTNLFEQLTGPSGLNMGSSFPVGQMVMGHLPTVILFISAMVGLGFFIKRRISDE